jgi:hypothetical protein
VQTSAVDERSRQSIETIEEGGRLGDKGRSESGEGNRKTRPEAVDVEP